MRRREFVLAFACGIAGARTALAQPQPGPRRLGVIMGEARNAPEYSAARAAFIEKLQSLGWREGGNLIVDERWAAGDKENAQAAADEITGLHSDVILAQSNSVVNAILSMTRALPIVFVHVADPVASGFISSLARPGANVTGVTNTEPSIGGKWLQFLKEATPTLNRAAMLVNPETQPDRGAMFLRPFETAAGSLGIATVNGEVHALEGVKSVMSGLATMPGGGVIVIPDAFFASHSAQIVAFAEGLRLPTIYPYRYYVAEGGLLSYGVNNIDLLRQAAPYVDHILRGAKPAELPVQQPTRFQLVINLRTANSLGLALPPSLLARADEVIE